MESQGLPDQLQVTAATYERLRTRYHLAERGPLLVKGMGEMVTYWLLAAKPIVEDQAALNGWEGGPGGAAHKNRGTIP
ncbi:adenylate/guanylate cyclase domain-containing protein [Trichothermofontia sp.]